MLTKGLCKTENENGTKLTQKIVTKNEPKPFLCLASIVGAIIPKTFYPIFSKVIYCTFAF